MEDPRLKVIADELRGYTGDCRCHEGYTSRNLIDPECAYHIVPSEEAAADILAALDKLKTNVASHHAEQPAIKWNVFLFDQNRKYGDFMVTINAGTAAEAERSALAQNPGATIAHPTALSPYGTVPLVEEKTARDLMEWGGLRDILRA